MIYHTGVDVVSIIEWCHVGELHSMPNNMHFTMPHWRCDDLTIVWLT